MRRERIQQILSELGPGASLRPSAASWCLAAGLADFLLSREPVAESLKEVFRTDRRTLIQRLHPLAETWCRERVPELLPMLAAENLLLAGGPAAAFTESSYLERIVHLGLERALINPAAPPLLVSPVPEPRSEEKLRGRPMIGVVFDYPLAITHELYPLWTDAFVFPQTAPACPSFEVVGIHVSWLDAACSARRTILFHPDLDLFLEAPLSQSRPVAAVLLLCQSPGTHQDLAARLTKAAVPHLNPYELARIADDKWQCFTRWTENHVATPPTCLLGRDLSPQAAQQAIGDFIDHHQREHGWVIQPRRGTEGEQVTWVEEGETAEEELFQGWQEMAATDDAILRPRVGLAGLPSRDGPLPFDLRLHVSFDGVNYRAESGYLLVAPGPDQPVSSTARGGLIEPFSRLEEVVRIRADSPSVDRIPWTREDLDRVRKLVIRAVEAVGPLGLAGVDVKLDCQADGLMPSVLDLNPRPAGLLHADLFDAEEAGIASGLWRRLAAFLVPPA